MCLVSAARDEGERGAVMVLVALFLPVFLIFASFAIDAAHYWDFSRNLQNKVDAAVLAAGSTYGGTCFGGTPTQAELDTIGQTAQQYAGPANGTPSPGGAPNGPNLPYPYSSATPYQNQQSTPGGASPSNFFLVLNGSTSYDKGGRNFDKGNFCSATYNNPAEPVIDGWATQASVPMFIPLLGFHPNISAHARVQLQGLGGGASVLPIAVPDPAQTPCLRAEVINDLTGTLVQDASGNNIDVAMNAPTSSQPYWTVTLPALNVPNAQLSVQAYIPDDCSNPGYPGSGTVYDPSNGVEFVNTYAPLPAGNPANPALGSVYLTRAGCDDAGETAAQDAYFFYFPKSTTNGCSVTVNAQVKFPSGLNNTKVFVSMDGGNAQQMTAGANNTYTQNFAIPSESGRHTFTINWTASGGNKGNFNGGNPVQATYSAFQDPTSLVDSGPIVKAFIGDTLGDTDVNTIQQGTSQTLTVGFLLQGLQLAQPGDQPIILRAAVQNRKATGAFDCWAGSASASALANAIINGCPDPVSTYSAAQGCVVLPATPLTCADLVPGNKRNQVTSAFQTRIESAVDGNQSSPCDAWQAYATGTPISGVEPWDTSVVDPRIMVMVVTSPADLAGHGGPNNTVRILGFATFYVTGYDGDPWLPSGKKGGQTIPNCPAPMNQDEAYPGSGNGIDQIWGHFIKYVALSGIPNGQTCNPNDVNACVPALTR
jgi:hypothetical protein